MNPNRMHLTTFFTFLFANHWYGGRPTAKFFLSFDSSAAAPVRLLCASPDTPDAPTPAPTLDEIIKTQAKGPAGQFYQQEYAHNLLNTLRSVGPSAKVVLDDSEASDDQRRHYERFQTKLRAGELVCYLLLLIWIPVLNLSTSRLSLWNLYTKTCSPSVSPKAPTSCSDSTSQHHYAPKRGISWSCA